MYQALYRKYRPTVFSDVCGQDHITAVLKNQLETGKVSHAYIFCGSRGTGKTTCAKILAKAVNCEHPVGGEPCNECDSCRAILEERLLDVVEMDAASNNGVDHIRRICDEVQFLPTEGKKRVYIIDEVHMLSGSAFNALLKTIEEPPSHVLFILATTEMNDIPATVMSRCQRFDFKRITPQVVSQRLLWIAERENINLTPEASLVIAKLSDGALRDALSLLEACQGIQGTISADAVASLLGLGDRKMIFSLCRAILRQDVFEALSLVRDFYEKKNDFKDVIGDLIAIYRDLLVIHSVSDYKKFVECYEGEISVLEEISKLATIETLLYQSNLMESFYISYDRIATGKKASAEILMIRLCKDELSTDPAAILSRLSKLESGKPSVPQTVGSSARLEDSSRISKNVSEVSSLHRENVPILEKRGFAGEVKLRNVLQKEAFLKPWLDQLEFEKSGSVLIVRCGSFVKGVLLSSGAEKTILSALGGVDPEIHSVSIEEKNNQTVGTQSSDLEDL